MADARMSIYLVDYLDTLLVTSTTGQTADLPRQLLAWFEILVLCGRAVAELVALKGRGCQILLWDV
eukprot:12296839-Karenia_brevis.AAC.1